MDHFPCNRSTNPRRTLHEIPNKLYNNIKDAASYFLHSQHTTSQFEEEIPSDLDKLWSTSTFCSSCLLQERNKNYIDWRTLGDEDKKANFFILRNKKNDDFLGYVTYYIDDSTNNVLVVDFFSKDESRSLKSLFSSFVFNIRNKKINSISLEFLGMNSISKIIESSGFKFRDERPMFYVFNENTSRDIKESEWFLTSWDEDAV